MSITLQRPRLDQEDASPPAAAHRDFPLSRDRTALADIGRSRGIGLHGARHCFSPSTHYQILKCQPGAVKWGKSPNSHSFPVELCSEINSAFFLETL